MKVFDVMNGVDKERFELAAYKLNGVTKICFDQRKGG